MARINLLPWRAERQRQRKQRFNALLLAAGLAGLALSSAIYMYYRGQISGQNERNAFLEQQMTELDKQIAEIKEIDAKKADLLQRKKAIEELQGNRYQMVHMFDALSRSLTEGIVLTGVKQEGDIMTIEGRSDSNARVAQYMRNIQQSGWLSSPDVTVIEAAAPTGAVAGAPAAPAAQGTAAQPMNTVASVFPYQFTIRVKLSNPNAPVDPNASPGSINTISTPVPAAVPATTPTAPAPATVPAVNAPAAPAPVPAPAQATPGQPQAQPQPQQQPQQQVTPAQPAPPAVPGMPNAAPAPAANAQPAPQG